MEVYKITVRGSKEDIEREREREREMGKREPMKQMSEIRDERISKKEAESKRESEAERVRRAWVKGRVIRCEKGWMNEWMKQGGMYKRERKKNKK